MSLIDLKQGDKVAVYSGSIPTIGTIDRVTQTQVIVAGRRYRKRSGKSVGVLSAHSVVSWIAEITPSVQRHLDRALEHRDRRMLVQLAGDDTHPIKSVRQCIAVLRDETRRGTSP